MKKELSTLLARLIEAKNLESDAKKGRLSIEAQIQELVINEKLEGSKSESDDDFSVTVTNGLTRSVDFDQLKALNDELPDNLKLIDYKPSLNLSNLRTLEKTANDAFMADVNSAITIKPKKPSVSIKRKN